MNHESKQITALQFNHEMEIVHKNVASMLKEAEKIMGKMNRMGHFLSDDILHQCEKPSPHPET